MPAPLCARIDRTTATICGSSGAIAYSRWVSAGTRPSSYAARVDWGDGSAASAGAVSGAGGAYRVAAAHAYAAAGTYRVSVSVSGPGGAAVSAAGTALVR